MDSMISQLVHDLKKKMATGFFLPSKWLSDFNVIVDKKLSVEFEEQQMEYLTLFGLQRVMACSVLWSHDDRSTAATRGDLVGWGWIGE